MLQKKNIISVAKSLKQGGPRLRAWRATLRFEEKFAGLKEKSSIAIRRLVCSSSRPNVCCTPNAMLDSKVIFTLKFSVSLFGTQNRDFLLEKRYTTHQENNKHTKKITNTPRK